MVGFRLLPKWSSRSIKSLSSPIMPSEKFVFKPSFYIYIFNKIYFEPCFSPILLKHIYFFRKFTILACIGNIIQCLSHDCKSPLVYRLQYSIIIILINWRTCDLQIKHKLFFICISNCSRHI